MRYVIDKKINIDNDDIIRYTTRIKVLLINDENEILVGNSFNCYQFIGGHLEDGENLIDCLNREVLEEVGIELNIKEANPFLIIDRYYDDKNNIEKKVCCKYYYYVIKTNLKPNNELTNYTEEEKEGNFKYEYINIDDFEKVITENFKKHERAELIGMEMLSAFRLYKESLNN